MMRKDVSAGGVRTEEVSGASSGVDKECIADDRRE